MFRSNKKIVALLIFAICLFSIRHVQADEFYEISVLVNATGLTPQEAEDNAWDASGDEIADAIAGLGQNEEVESCHYPNHGFIAPDEYQIHIIINIRVVTPSPAGGGSS